MPTATTAKPEPAQRRSAAKKTEETGVSLKDPASLVKAYFRLRSKVLDKQEELTLRVVERTPKSLKLPSIDRAQVLKLPRRGQKSSAS